VKEEKGASQYEGAGYKTTKVIGAKRERRVLRKNEEEAKKINCWI
jgi:hypothetical protein